MNIPVQLKTKKLKSRQLLSIGFYIYKKTFNHVFLFLCLINLPLILSISLIQYNVNNQFIEQLSINSSLETLIFFFSFNLIISLIGLAIFTFSYKTIVILGYDYIYRKPFNYGKLLKAVFNEFFSLWVLMLRLVIIYIFRLFLLIIPGIIYLMNNSSVPLAFIFRQERIEDAFYYNSIIIKGNAGRVFSLFLYPFIIYIVFALFINGFLLSSIDSSSTTNNYSSYMFGLLYQIILTVFYPGLINAHLCLFLNAEAQKRLGS